MTYGGTVKGPSFRCFFFFVASGVLVVQFFDALRHLLKPREIFNSSTFVSLKCKSINSHNTKHQRNLRTYEQTPKQSSTCIYTISSSPQLHETKDVTLLRPSKALRKTRLPATPSETNRPTCMNASPIVVRQRPQFVSQAALRVRDRWWNRRDSRYAPQTPQGTQGAHKEFQKRWQSERLFWGTCWKKVFLGQD